MNFKYKENPFKYDTEQVKTNKKENEIHISPKVEIKNILQNNLLVKN